MSHSIEWMNARRSGKAATGGVNYRKPQTAKQRADIRARDAGLDAIDIAHETIVATFSDFRSWFASLPSVASIADGSANDVF